MDVMIVVGVILIIGAVFAAVLYAYAGQKIRNDYFAKLVSKELITGYNPKPQHTVPKYISADFETRKWRPEVFTNCKLYDFSNIADFELIQDGQTTVTKGGLAGAAIGGLLAGGIGAIIGSNTAKRSVSQVSNVYIRITLVNAPLTAIDISLYNGAPISTTSLLYRSTVAVAQDVLSLLRAITVTLERENKAETPAITSSADEIAKYKKLMDEGAITEEEYNAKKKQLLEV